MQKNHQKKTHRFQKINIKIHLNLFSKSITPLPLSKAVAHHHRYISPNQSKSSSFIQKERKNKTDRTLDTSTLFRNEEKKGMCVLLVKIFHGKRDGNELKHKHYICEERNKSPEYSFSDEVVVISGKRERKNMNDFLFSLSSLFMMFKLIKMRKYKLPYIGGKRG